MIRRQRNEINETEEEVGDEGETIKPKSERIKVSAAGRSLACTTISSNFDSA